MVAPGAATVSRAVRHVMAVRLKSRVDSSVRLTDREQERLLIFSAAELARRHRAAGLKLSAPEAIALMCDAMFEAARAGASLRRSGGGRVRRASRPTDAWTAYRRWSTRFAWR